MATTRPPTPVSQLPIGRHLAFLLCVGLSLCPCWTDPAAGETLSIYRYVLGTDVPESPGMLLIDPGAPRVLRGSAPKPVLLSLTAGVSTRPSAPGGDLDFAPYFFAGGGIRDLARYRSNSVGGRLTRVLTKTILSIAAGPSPDDDRSTRLGLAVRATFHDPHDPVLNTALPESVDAVLLRAQRLGGVSPAAEDISDRGADIGPALAAARREMRGSRGIQVSGGYGESWLLRGGSIDSDSAQTMQRVYWLAGQITFDGRFDVLLTGQLRDPVGARRHAWIGAALLRKMNPVDVATELSFDARTSKLYPGVRAEVRVLPRAQVSASFQTGVDDLATRTTTKLFARLGFRWFLAYDS